MNLLAAATAVLCLALTGCAAGPSSPSIPTSPSLPAARHTASPPTTPAPSAADPFAARLRRAAGRRPGTISAAAYDFRTGHSYLLKPGLSAYTASIVKLPILLAAEARARTAGGGLSAAQRATAKAMIEVSDNNAATALWRAAGKTASLTSLFAQLGMRHTVSAPVLFLPWDGVRTTAPDQIRLLRGLVTGMPGVTRSDRSYALGLMENVASEQTWGVPTGTPSGSVVAVKNGWVPVGSQGWTVNSIGVVESGNQPRYALAVLSTGSPTEAAGIASVDLVARSAATALGR